MNLVSSDPLTGAKLRIASGISSLYSDSFIDAAKKFTAIPIELGNEFDSVISSEDIALYGSILSLASLDRVDLISSVLDSSLFKHRLELLPWMRDALRHFSRADYGTFLSIIESKRGEMLLDIHLHPHVNNIFEQIRDRCLVQYFNPFESVRLEAMG